MNIDKFLIFISNQIGNTFPYFIPYKFMETLCMHYYMLTKKLVKILLFCSRTAS